MFAALVNREFEAQPMLDRRAALVYALLLIQAAVAFALIWLLGFSIEAPTLTQHLGGASILLVPGLMARRIGHDLVGGTCEALALVYFFSSVSVLVAFPLTAIALPFADNSLAAADAAIGFHAPAFIAWVAGIPFALDVLSFAYRSLGWQVVPILIVLFALKQPGRAWQMLSALVLSLFITLAIYPLAPAAGSFIHAGITPADYPQLSGDPWKFGPVIEAIRDHGQRVIDNSMICGFVSFPSFHTAAAIIFAWAMWPVRFVRYPVLVLNVLVIIASLIFGAHYLVDLIGGTVIAVLAILALSPRNYKDNSVAAASAQALNRAG